MEYICNNEFRAHEMNTAEKASGLVSRPAFKCVGHSMTANHDYEAAMPSTEAQLKGLAQRPCIEAQLMGRNQSQKA